MTIDWTQITLEPIARERLIRTRARRNDCDTSKEAAKHAVTAKADAERIAIAKAVKAASQGRTAREVAYVTGIDYIEVQRRISECAGLMKSTDRREGCAVWVADPFFAVFQ